MAKDSRYCVQLRRRKEGKTDYKARKALVISGKPRLVVRNTLKNVIAQIIVAKPHGDEVLVSAHSRELKKYEWKAHAGNLPSAYLTGLLCGLKAKAQGVKEVILDIGLHSPSKGARVFAMLKGVLDAGVHVPHSEEKLPDEKRIEGEHIAQYAESLASNPEEYQSKFSKYLEQKLPPEDLPKHFAKVKTEILAAFKSGGKKA
ncbi:50S ribosomal protein L18 [Candidatus Bathyarchaeota archaeon CG_4_8_14_3_um_filter_42_8]|jgi:large subunit ribosomal protein L18|nr:MAG: 50S ribosomal protein L18 [Candidatus Bathyarchaeota archaeon CG_4_8_14_3_um_filter_42_8]